MIEDLPDILHRLIGQKDHLQVRFPEPDISGTAAGRLDVNHAAGTVRAGGEVDAAAVDRPGHYPEHSVWSAETGIQYSALGRKKPAHGKTERFPAWAARGFLPVAEPE